MCQDCGCDAAAHEHAAPRVVDVAHSVLAKNHAIAHRNRHWFDARGINAVNIMSSPGSGKTALLEKTLDALNGKVNIAVLVGDLQTDNDAKRLSGKGARVRQINTHSACHLDAEMIEKELDTLADATTSLLLIENVGNLVCPAAFALGEHRKVALLSITEGEDKPAKYPVLFHDAHAIVLTKMDLQPHLKWDEAQAIAQIRRVNPSAAIIRTSAYAQTGLDEWTKWLTGRAA